MKESGSQTGSANPPWQLRNHDPRAAILYLETVDHALFLCKAGSLELRWLNPPAQALLEAGGPLSVSNGRLHAHSKAELRWINNLSPNGSGSSIWLDQSSHPKQIVGARCFRSYDDLDMVAITIFDIETQPRFMLPNLFPVFNLTAAEQKILARITEGLRAELIAAQSAVTIETVRTHIRRIYAKMGVSSREELISLVNKFQIPSL